MATKTTIALRSLLRSLKAGRICKLEDLSALEILITPCRPADPQTRKDIPIPAECEDLQRRMNEIVDLLGRAKAKGLKHPNMKRTPQDLAAGSSIEALTMYCGLNYEMDYTCNGNKLMLFVSKRIYVMPDLETPYGEAMEFTLGQARISIVYLSLPRDEADCAVYARELFCLLAMATKSCRVRAEDQSHTVGVVSLWSDLQIRALMAIVPTSFIKGVADLGALSPTGGFNVELSPYLDQTNLEDWKILKALLHKYSLGSPAPSRPI